MIKLEKNLPGLQIYQLEDLSICDRLIERLNHIRKNKLSENNNNTCFKSQGYQSGNLLDLGDPDILEFSALMRFHLAQNLGIDQEGLDFVFLHFLDYGQQGRMDEHDHKDKEDLTFLLYLNDCNDGATVFYLNHANEFSKTRSEINVQPRKGKISVFNSTVPHRGDITTSNKKIFAGGLCYNAELKRNY